MHLQSSLHLPFSSVDGGRRQFKSANGEWRIFHGTWLGHYILDGNAIADEYRIRGTHPNIAEDVGFTNIFGTVGYRQAEFTQGHVEIDQSIFKGISVKTSIGKLRFVLPDVAIVDISGR